VYKLLVIDCKLIAHFLLIIDIIIILWFFWESEVFSFFVDLIFNPLVFQVFFKFLFDFLKFGMDETVIIFFFFYLFLNIMI